MPVPVQTKALRTIIFNAVVLIGATAALPTLAAYDSAAATSAPVYGGVYSERALALFADGASQIAQRRSGAANANAKSEPAPELSLYRVGATGIRCYREPCPRKGIIAAEAVPRLHPLWSSETPPRMRGDEESQRRIVAAWEAGECMIIRGSLLSDALLQVEQIIGPC